MHPLTLICCLTAALLSAETVAAYMMPRNPEALAAASAKDTTVPPERSSKRPVPVVKRTSIDLAEVQPVQQTQQQRSSTGDHYAPLVKDLLRWTDEVIAQLDRFGIVDTPWRSRRAESARASSNGSAASPLLPKLRPARVAGGGFGLVARFNF